MHLSDALETLIYIFSTVSFWTIKSLWTKLQPEMYFLA